jgi:hypothetical protein
VARCSGFKPDGTPCERIVGASQSYCYSHDPERAAERHKAASKAARSKPNRELADVKDSLRAMIEDVRSGTMDRGDAAVCGQLYNSLLRALSVELKAREQEEVLTRVEELESYLQGRGYGP